MPRNIGATSTDNIQSMDSSSDASSWISVDLNGLFSTGTYGVRPFIELETYEDDILINELKKRGYGVAYPREEE